MSAANISMGPTETGAAAPRLPPARTDETENSAIGKKLPPSPADVRRYFELRRHRIDGFSPGGIVENERLWLALCKGRVTAVVRNPEDGGGL